jgi:hypothetical protein
MEIWRLKRENNFDAEAKPPGRFKDEPGCLAWMFCKYHGALHL